MEYSRTTKYALQALSLMAKERQTIISADRLHKELKIPKKYLQRLLTKLSKSGIITSVRGKYGGYRFSKRTENITMADIIHAVEGFRTESRCFFGFSTCILDAPCPMHEAWSRLQLQTVQVLTTTTLADIVRS